MSNEVTMQVSSHFLATSDTMSFLIVIVVVAGRSRECSGKFTESNVTGSSYNFIAYQLD